MNTHHDTPARDGTPPARLPVHEAAHLLGISENAVRARLRRGTLTGVKRGTSWYVLVRDTDIPPAHTTVHQEVVGDTPPHTTAHDAVHVDLAPLAELIERQARELAEMREAAAVWQIRARQAEEQLKQLTAGTSEPETDQEATRIDSEQPQAAQTNEPAPTGLRALWRRFWGS